METWDLDVEQRIDEATSQEEVAKQVGIYAAHCEYTFFGLGLQVPVPPDKTEHIFLSNYPKKWRQEYDTMGYVQNDPVVLHALRSSMPIMWSDLIIESPEQKHVFKKASEFGLVHGITVPYLTHRGIFGLLSLARESRPAFTPAAAIRIKQQLLWLMHLAAEKILSLESNTQEVPKRQLTVREAQCLKLALDGHRINEIAEIMEVSASTVSYFFGQARKKLGVTGRSAILAEALKSGALSVHMVEMSSAPVLTARDNEIDERRHPDRNLASPTERFGRDARKSPDRRH